MFRFNNLVFFVNHLLCKLLESLALIWVDELSTKSVLVVENIDFHFASFAFIRAFIKICF